MPDKNSSGDDLLKMLVTAGLIGGGQTHEQIVYGKESQVWVQVLQAIALVGAVGATVAGIGLMGGGLLYVVRQASDTWDLLMVAVPAAVIMMGIRGTAIRVRQRIVEMQASGQGEKSSQPAAALAAMIEAVTTVVAILAMLTIVQVIDDAGSMEPMDFVLPAIGLGLAISGTLLVWRFVNELFNPLFPKSPTTEILERLVESMQDQGPEQVVEVRGPFPVRANGRIAAPVMPAQELPAGGGRVEVQLTEDYKLFVDLVALVDRAMTHGLSRAANVDNEHPRLRLPSGERLTRGRLEQLWQYGAEAWGLWAYESEKGITPSWNMEPDQALRVLRAAWERREGAREPDDAT